MQKNDVIILAAGGTGGHLFPAQSLAEELINKGYKPFLICDQRTNEFLRGDLAKIDSLKVFAPRPGNGIISNFINLFKMIPIVLKLRRVMKQNKARSVVGFGGYPSLPSMIAALSLGLPTYIHEQNAVIGKVNRLILPFVNKVFLSFPQTKGLDDKYKSKAIVVGNLVRKSIVGYAIGEKPSHDGDYIDILVIGGSQGSKILTEFVPLSIKQLPEKLQEKLKIHQQARLNLVAETKRLYKATKAKVEVKDFFNNIGNLMQQADLVICRAGASTVTEVAMLSKPAVFIPLKIATGNHQYYNAKFLEDAGGAIIINEEDLNIELLANTLLDLLMHPNKLKAMGIASNKIAMLGAAEKIVKSMES